jgi:hypothetical protein
MILHARKSLSSRGAPAGSFGGLTFFSPMRYPPWSVEC